MTPRRDRRFLSPVLADEQLVGEGLTRRLRIMLLAVVTAFLLTNVTSYLIGQAVRADADRDTRVKVAELERQFDTDLAERRRRRDAEVARQDAELRQLRADACTLADRIVPRDGAVQRLRQRYGCIGDARPAATPALPGARDANGSTAGGGSTSSPAAPAGPPGPQRPPPPKPSPSSRPPPKPANDGLICLPLVGCIL